MAAGPCCEYRHNGRIVHPDSIVEAGSAIRDGRIVAIGAMPAATEMFYFRNETVTANVKGLK